MLWKWECTFIFTIDLFSLKPSFHLLFKKKHCFFKQTKIEKREKIKVEELKVNRKGVWSLLIDIVFLLMKELRAMAAEQNQIIKFNVVHREMETII